MGSKVIFNICIETLIISITSSSKRGINLNRQSKTGEVLAGGVRHSTMSIFVGLRNHLHNDLLLIKVTTKNLIRKINGPEVILKGLRLIALKQRPD